MTFQEFLTSQTQPSPPIQLSDTLTALWFVGKGDWQAAHDIVENMSNKEAAWIHAYLHREEGDNWNANYWYQRANKSMPNLPLRQEWENMVKHILEKNTNYEVSNQ